MEFKHKKFCDQYLLAFEFNHSCVFAKVNKRIMRDLLYDNQSEVSIYLQEQTDLFAVHNSFITNEMIKFKLAQVLFDREAKWSDVISASKVLLGYEDSVDKSAEFTAIIKAMRE